MYVMPVNSDKNIYLNYIYIWKKHPETFILLQLFI